MRVAPPQRASRYPPLSRVNSTPASSSQWIAEGASLVSTSTSLGSAVSCELRMTSSAWISGESSSPNAAWIPPCAFAELHAWSVVLVASPTAAPACAAETAAARPEAPLPTTSTSKERPAGTAGYYPICLFLSLSIVIQKPRERTSQARR